MRKIAGVCFLVMIAVGFGVYFYNSPEPKNARDVSSDIRANPSRLKEDVLAIVNTKVPRNHTNEEGLNEAANHIQKQWEAAGFKVEEQKYIADKKSYKNLIVSFGPEAAPRIIVGAHYDVAGDAPGADDNASGVAGLLELSRLLRQRSPELNHRIDLVAYTLEEPPFFRTHFMGSAIHAAWLKSANIDVKLMLSLEMIGYYSDEPNSQRFPLDILSLVYPTVGNFVSVIGNYDAPMLVRRIKVLMQNNSKIRVEGLAAPKALVGIDFSDHRSYWEKGYPALMVTDTAFFRNKNYHKITDTPDTLNYEKMAEVVEGVYGAVTNF